MLVSPADAARVARALVALGAVRVADATPFIYTSGWASPVYVDARLLMSSVALRTEVMDIATHAIAPHVAASGINAVVGAESAGIAFAAWLAERLRLPLLYLRKRPIGWGITAQLEGRMPAEARVLLVDDVTTDGRSKGGAAAALRQAGTVVDDALVLLDYALYPTPAAAADTAALRLHALATWPQLHAALQEDGRLTGAQAAMLADFSAAPVRWSVAHGGIGA
ncbi:orotate phosphoribosyltransferase [Xylophilus ampelinus]|uniref:Orotate phosphoribosyltransferase n=1 Tax=Xylophilus ampelinus TaxID=54067 RepID=A0A318SMM0_9BURK|nr:phosphoribosyltransferase [Xylophilus ampelinus]MCS4509085.1 phosphoribosyltransferase [Xylophilus ampelinus]PYE79888.1 orotate phosphoribosyltransferase [Xylophilus ampelinus]